jgi:hypothetical protein
VSWCRWSTNGFRCDLYIYDSVGDFVSVNVAGRKKRFNVFPEPSAFIRRDGVFEVKAGWRWKSYRVLKELWGWYYAVLPWRDIKWQAGESLQFTDMQQLAQWLYEARQHGLRFPDSVWIALANSVKDSTYTESP